LLTLPIVPRRNSHPQILERSPAERETIAASMWDAGVRFWSLKRRSPGQYAIIRRFHNLSSPYVKEAADIDTDGDGGGRAQHALLDQAITVQGAEEAVYIDIAMQSGVLLEVLLGGAAGAGGAAWVKLALVEGSVVVLPYASTYRLRMPGRGCVGLLRARMD
jgi:hypothetical protein